MDVNCPKCGTLLDATPGQMVVCPNCKRGYKMAPFWDGVLMISIGVALSTIAMVVTALSHDATIMLLMPLASALVLAGAIRWAIYPLILK